MLRYGPPTLQQTTTIFTKRANRNPSKNSEASHALDHDRDGSAGDALVELGALDLNLVAGGVSLTTACSGGTIPPRIDIRGH
jgi:hypothetical protein